MKEGRMSINSKDAKGKKIESNAPPPVNSPAPSVSQGVLGIEAEEVVMETMDHVIGQWFNKYTRPAPTLFHRCRDEPVRLEKTVRTTEVVPPTNPTPLTPVVAVSRGNLVEGTLLPRQRSHRLGVSTESEVDTKQHPWPAQKDFGE
ncbi:hypothetical protein GOBAR_DD11757 [Gossypium barbadense]|nr:hypothetical protein GOBAR_DD11757 [Gossypium barbadense]